MHFPAEMRHWLGLFTFHRKIMNFEDNTDAEDVIVHHNNLNIIFVEQLT